MACSLDLAHLQTSWRRFARAGRGLGELALDGKTVRGAKDSDGNSISTSGTPISASASRKNQPKLFAALGRCRDQPHPDRPRARPDRTPHHPGPARTGRSAVPARQPGHAHRTLRQRSPRHASIGGRGTRHHQPVRHPGGPSTAGQPDPPPLGNRVPPLAPRYRLPRRPIPGPYSIPSRSD